MYPVYDFMMMMMIMIITTIIIMCIFISFSNVFVPTGKNKIIIIIIGGSIEGNGGS